MPLVLGIHTFLLLFLVTWACWHGSNTEICSLVRLAKPGAKRAEIWTRFFATSGGFAFHHFLVLACTQFTSCGTRCWASRMCGWRSQRCRQKIHRFFCIKIFLYEIWFLLSHFNYNNLMVSYQSLLSFRFKIKHIATKQNNIKAV